MYRSLELFGLTVYVTGQLIVLLLGAVLHNPVSNDEVLLSWWLGIRGLWYLLLSLLRWFSRAKKDAITRCAPRLHPYWLVYATAAYPGRRPRGR